MTYADLIAQVRAQIDVTDDQAYDWILDRARVMNATAEWLVLETAPVASGGLYEFPLPVDCLKLEAVLIDGFPYKRSTLSQLDILRACSSWKRRYADGVTADGANAVAVNPTPSIGQMVVLRYLADVPDDRTGSPPFPNDIHSAIADGAIGIGLARSDERMDSAGYFDARFTDGTQRLRLRRHSHIGRGGTPIRLVS